VYLRRNSQLNRKSAALRSCVTARREWRNQPRRRFQLQPRSLLHQRTRRHLNHENVQLNSLALDRIPRTKPRTNQRRQQLLTLPRRPIHLNLRSGQPIDHLLSPEGLLAQHYLLHAPTETLLQPSDEYHKVQLRFGLSPNTSLPTRKLFKLQKLLGSTSLPAESCKRMIGL
jgi:hypothetical protein